MTIEQQLYRIICTSNTLKIGVVTVLKQPEEIAAYLKKQAGTVGYNLLEHIGNLPNFYYNINREFNISFSEKSISEITSFIQLVSEIRKLTGRQ